MARTKTKAINHYDQASRYLAKLDALGWLLWLLRGLTKAWEFDSWLDTRTIPFPGEPDRICDTVACLYEKAAPERWALVQEFQSQPDEAMFGRLLEYLGRLWRERRPASGGPRRYHVAAVVVNLTGHGDTARDLRLGRTGLRTCLQVAERNLTDEDAARTLWGIRAGRIALRAGGDSADAGRGGARYNRRMAAPGRSGAGCGAARRLRRPGAAVRGAWRLSRRLGRSIEGVERAAI